MVSGRVQGVGFRYFVVQVARRAGLVGWVRNLPDGTVECEAEGDRSALEWFLEQLRRGPGRVEAVVAAWKDSPGSPAAADFRILA